MILFLTSHIGGSYKEDGIRIPTRLCEDNELLKNLQERWKNNTNVLIVGGAANDISTNDSIKNIFSKAFEMSGLSIGKMSVCDERNIRVLDVINNYDVIILAGGHVPTQNNFFSEINLKQHLCEFKGIVIGISAGSMNCAEVVYAQPEYEGESIDKEYQRFINGLGITKYNILPHYQDIKDDIIDGKRLFEDITYGDSFGKQFFALEDGSYILIEDNKAIIYGTAYIIADGKIMQICEEGKSKCLI